MTRPMIHELNVSTQEEIIRAMNDEEYAQLLLDVEATEAREAAQAQANAEAEALAAAKKAAKAEALAALGLSQEIINILAD